MTFRTGAAWCHERGLHSWRKTEPGLEECSSCPAARFIAYTDDEIDRFDARDALAELNRAEAEACDRCSDGEWDLRSHEPER